MSLLALEGVSDLYDTIETVQERLNPGLEILGILLTRVDGRNLLLNAEVRSEINRYFGSGVFDTIISVNSALNRAQLSGEPIFDFDSSSSGARNYKLFTQELLTRLNDDFVAEDKKVSELAS